VSLRHPGVFWTHGDDERILHAVGPEGESLARQPLSVQPTDWEDIALASCGEAEFCLYLADTGDNAEARELVRILRVAEPEPTGSDTLILEAFPVRFPDGPRDVEALLVLPGERIILVTKGRNHPPTVYRYPGPLRPDTVVLETVQQLGEAPRLLPRQITGGAVAPGGRIVALRTYESLQFYRLPADTLEELADGLVNLRSLGEAQGEGVGIGLDGLVALTSEGGPPRGPGSFVLLKCALPGA
jgi:hypothetical protein